MFRYIIMARRKTRRRKTRRKRTRRKRTRRNKSRKRRKGGRAPPCPKEKCPCPQDGKRVMFKSKLHKKCVERRKVNPAAWYNWKNPEASGKKDEGRAKWLEDNFMNFEERQAKRARDAKANKMAHAQLERDLGTVGALYNEGSKAFSAAGKRRRKRRTRKR